MYNKLILLKIKYIIIEIKETIETNYLIYTFRGKGTCTIQWGNFGLILASGKILDFLALKFFKIKKIKLKLNKKLERKKVNLAINIIKKIIKKKVCHVIYSDGRV